MNAEETYTCENCGETVAKHRGVCPSCGHMTPWFRVRFIVGCLSLSIAFLSLIAILLTAAFMPAPQ